MATNVRGGHGTRHQRSSTVQRSRTLCFGTISAPSRLNSLRGASTWSLWHTTIFAAPSASHGKAWQASPATTLDLRSGSRMRAVAVHTVPTPATNVVSCMCMLYRVHAYGRLTCVRDSSGAHSLSRNLTIDSRIASHDRSDPAVQRWSAGGSRIGRPDSKRTCPAIFRAKSAPNSAGLYSALVRSHQSCRILS